MDVRVFYFTGLLGSGKTTFIDKTIQDLDPQLRTVVICAEVGDEDFTEGTNVVYAGKLTWKLFDEVQDKYDPDIVFIEDDGQRRPEPDQLVRMFPDNWNLSQIVCMKCSRSSGWIYCRASGWLWSLSARFVPSIS